MIHALAPNASSGIGHKLTSQTTKVRAIRIKAEASDQYYVLVDTPGFDDTHMTDSQILTLIATWLEKTYGPVSCVSYSC
jgi:hypothetical protein